MTEKTKIKEKKPVCIKIPLKEQRVIETKEETSKISCSPVSLIFEKRVLSEWEPRINECDYCGGEDCSIWEGCCNFPDE